jgi:p-cumate 2,3-dioxygenase beta subunit
MTPAGGPSASVLDVEAFLYREADLLDDWKLDEWLELFLPEARYEVPATDAPDGRPETSLHIIADDMTVLAGRVDRLKSVQAYAENPHSRTRRFITNVRILDVAANDLLVSANFMVTRSRKGATDTYIGRYRHTLRSDPDTGFRFVHRRAVLDLDALRPHGRISIIL